MYSRTLAQTAILATAVLFAATGCEKELEKSEDEEIERSETWVEETHSTTDEPDYDIVFASKVHTIHISISASDFAEMQANVQELVGDGGRPGGGGGPGGGVDTNQIDEDPMYVPADITYDGEVWSNVGMRYKGNSSLSSSVRAGNGKLPFRLNMDYWEDDYPEIKNQRFYGFDKLTFSSGYMDDSGLRETLATEVFRGNGIAAARTAFYRVVVDTGDGDTYWGLYTAIEDPSDAMLNDQFGTESGNLYKPEGTGADWVTFDEVGFVKKNNEDEMDFADVEAAVAALHAVGISAEEWRIELEKFLDVDTFLRFLAVNTVMQNWDVYGAIAHNYYLYADPLDDDRLVWIPWDHNEALSSRTGLGGVPADAVEDIFHTGVGASWPLISVLLADDVYFGLYRDYVQDALEGPMEIQTFRARAQKLHDLIAPHMVGENGEISSHTMLSSDAAFERSVEELVSHVESRHSTVAEALEVTQ